MQTFLIIFFFYYTRQEKDKSFVLFSLREVCDSWVSLCSSIWSNFTVWISPSGHGSLHYSLTLPLSGRRQYLSQVRGIFPTTYMWLPNVSQTCSLIVNELPFLLTVTHVSGGTIINRELLSPTGDHDPWRKTKKPEKIKNILLISLQLLWEDPGYLEHLFLLLRKSLKKKENSFRQNLGCQNSACIFKENNRSHSPSS